MTELRLISKASFCDPASVKEEEVLERALAKVVHMGEDLGVSADQMIKLLDAGMSVRELLEFLAGRVEKMNLQERRI